MYVLAILATNKNTRIGRRIDPEFQLQPKITVHSFRGQKAVAGTAPRSSCPSTGVAPRSRAKHGRNGHPGNVTRASSFVGNRPAIGRAPDRAGAIARRDDDVLDQLGPCGA